MILSRPVNARASRMHDIVASVPLFTIRTFSIEGIQSQINSAISTSSGFGIPKLNPRVAASRTASQQLPARDRESPAPNSHVIDVFIAIDIPDLRPSAAVDKKRFAADVAKRAHRRIHAARDSCLRASKKFGRKSQDHDNRTPKALER